MTKTEQLKRSQLSSTYHMRSVLNQELFPSGVLLIRFLLFWCHLNTGRTVRDLTHSVTECELSDTAILGHLTSCGHEILFAGKGVLHRDCALLTKDLKVEVSL